MGIGLPDLTQGGGWEKKNWILWRGNILAPKWPHVYNRPTCLPVVSWIKDLIAMQYGAYILILIMILIMMRILSDLLHSEDWRLTALLCFVWVSVCLCACACVSYCKCQTFKVSIRKSLEENGMKISQHVILKSNSASHSGWKNHGANSSQAAALRQDEIVK